MIDSHCHIDASEFDADREQVIDAALGAGLARIIVPAVMVQSSGPLQSMATQFPCLRYALGVHPMYVERINQADWPRQLVQLRLDVELALADPQFVALGEIGLDRFVQSADHAWQQQIFEDQLRLARDFDLPVIMHVRKAIDPVLAALRRFGVQRGIAHAFNGSEQQAIACINQGLVMGFGGAMTFTRALQIRRLAVSLPLESLVLETDAPDIAPAWLAPGRNEPGELPRIAQVLADLRGISVAQVIAQTTENVKRVLPRLT